MGRGGKRRNAGRKPDPATVQFRTFWRNWFESEEGRAHLLKRLKDSDLVLVRVLDKCFSTPQSVKLDAADSRPIRVMLGSEGNELDLPYLPKGPMIIYPR